jgi:hypothetical protein
MKKNPATDVDRAAMETMKKLKMELKEVTLPDWPYSSLMAVLFADGAASFEELALNNQLGALKMQVMDAWPSCSDRRDFFRRLISFKRIGFEEKSRLRWRECSKTLTCFSCHRCVTSNSRLRTSLVIRRSRCEPGSFTFFDGRPRAA